MDLSVYNNNFGSATWRPTTGTGASVRVTNVPSSIILESIRVVGGNNLRMTGYTGSSSANTSLIDTTVTVVKNGTAYNGILQAIQGEEAIIRTNTNQTIRIRDYDSITSESAAQPVISFTTTSERPVFQYVFTAIDWDAIHQLDISNNAYTLRAFITNNTDRTLTPTTLTLISGDVNLNTVQYEPPIVFSTQAASFRGDANNSASPSNQSEIVTYSVRNPPSLPSKETTTVGLLNGTLVASTVHVLDITNSGRKGATRTLIVNNTSNTALPSGRLYLYEREVFLGEYNTPLIAPRIPQPIPLYSSQEVVATVSTVQAPQNEERTRTQVTVTASITNNSNQAVSVLLLYQTYGGALRLIRSNIPLTFTSTPEGYTAPLIVDADATTLVNIIVETSQ